MIYPPSFKHLSTLLTLLTEASAVKKSSIGLMAQRYCETGVQNSDNSELKIPRAAGYLG